MRSYIPLFYMDAITYPFCNPDAGLANFVNEKGPLIYM